MIRNALRRRCTRVLCGLLVALSVAACGKKGDLEPPSGIAPSWPRPYPGPLPVPQPAPARP